MAVGLGFLLLIGWIAVRWNAPPLRLLKGVSEVVVDVQTLGEYPTTVNRIRLIDLRESKVVWEIVRQSGTPQIHEFSLKPDNNSTVIDAQYGDYRVVAPAGTSHFALGKGVKYRIELWGGESDLTKSSGIFSFADR